MMKTVWVNIFDVLQSAKDGTSVRRFEDLKELGMYSYVEDKVYRKEDAKGGALKFLLKKISKYREQVDGLSVRFVRMAV